jgi:hypothetical protein
MAPSELLDAFHSPLDFLKWFFSCPLSLQGVIVLPETTNLSAVMFVHLVWSALFPFSNVFLNCFHEAVQLMQIHVREDWSTDGALRDAAVGRMERPVLEIARFKHGLDEVEKAFILNFLLEELHEQVVINRREVVADIHIDPPLHGIALPVDILQGGMG